MRELLPLFTGPSRYVGSEPGSVRKDPSAVDVRLALAFPDLFEVGMSYVGQKILYHVVNQRPEFWAERVFAPSLEVAEVLRERHAPLSTLESDTPLSDMHAVAFHLTHELCYTNVLYMLELSGLKLESCERGDAFPLVMAGGGCAFNAEPLARFLDVLVLGDGEQVLPEILSVLAAFQGTGVEKHDLLHALKSVPGVYVPCFFKDSGSGKALVPLHKDYQSIAKRVVPDLDAAPFPTKQVVPFTDTVHDRFAVEIARGCTRGCRFCQAGMIYRPVRERSPEDIESLVRAGLGETGYEELSFLSLSTGDYSALSDLFDRCFSRCRSEQVSISLPSLRVGSVDSGILDRMSRIRRTGITLAPEAGSARLRGVINKGVTEEDLLAHARALFSFGWQRVKLYFMIGLPTETEEDLDAILVLCRKVLALAGSGRTQVTAAISPFVPKPHTPFQWEPQLSLPESRSRIAYLQDIFKPFRRLTLRWHLPEMSFLEGVFSRGDRNLGPAVARAYELGAVFSSWTDRFDLRPWTRAFEECGLEPEKYLGPRDVDGPLPWDHLDCGVDKDFLRSERDQALVGSPTPDCRYGECQACGVCDFQEIRPRVVLKTRDQVEPRERVPGPLDKELGKGLPETPPDIGDLGHKAAHFRIWHAKLGSVRFLSGIEIMRALERAMRRAKLPLSFSAGFHPLPRMSFGMVLPVGVASLEEWFNVFMREAVTPEEIAFALGPRMPEGMRLIRVEGLSMNKKQPQALAEDFSLDLHGSLLEVEAWRAQWAGFLAKDTFLWTRRTKKGMRSMDIRPLLVDAAWPEASKLQFRLDRRDTYLNPLGLVEAVNPGLSPERFKLTKLKQWMEFSEPWA